MADWKRLAKAVLLVDGDIGVKETELIKKELLIDGLVGPAEAEFLIDLRKSASYAVPQFHQIVFAVVKKALLADGSISAGEARWLEKFLLSDGVVDDMEKALLRELKAEAKQTSPEFDALLKKYT